MAFPLPQQRKEARGNEECKHRLGSQVRGLEDGDAGQAADQELLRSHVVGVRRDALQEGRLGERDPCRSEGAGDRDGGDRPCAEGALRGTVGP